jgi:hypothetical protein
MSRFPCFSVAIAASAWPFFLSLSCPKVVPRVRCVDVDVGAFLTVKLSPSDYEGIFPRRRMKHVGPPEQADTHL